MHIITSTKFGDSVKSVIENSWVQEFIRSLLTAPDATRKPIITDNNVMCFAYVLEGIINRGLCETTFIEMANATRVDVKVVRKFFAKITTGKAKSLELITVYNRSERIKGINGKWSCRESVNRFIPTKRFYDRCLELSMEFNAIPTDEDIQNMNDDAAEWATSTTTKYSNDKVEMTVKDNSGEVQQHNVGEYQEVDEDNVIRTELVSRTPVKRNVFQDRGRVGSANAQPRRRKILGEGFIPPTNMREEVLQ